VVYSGKGRNGRCGVVYIFGVGGGGYIKEQKHNFLDRKGGGKIGLRKAEKKGQAGNRSEDRSIFGELYYLRRMGDVRKEVLGSYLLSPLAYPGSGVKGEQRSGQREEGVRDVQGLPRGDRVPDRAHADIGGDAQRKLTRAPEKKSRHSHFEGRGVVNSDLDSNSVWAKKFLSEQKNNGRICFCKGGQSFEPWVGKAATDRFPPRSCRPSEQP